LRQHRRGARRGVESIGGRSPRAGQNLPPSQCVQFAPVLTLLCSRRAVCFGRRSAGSRHERPSAVVPPSLPRPPLQAFGFRCREPRSRFTSVISERASREVPGSGAPALPSALGLEALASALAIARDDGVSAAGRRWKPASAVMATLLEIQVPRRGQSLPVQSHPRGSNRVGERGRANEELSGSPGQGPCASSGDAFRIGSG